VGADEAVTRAGSVQSVLEGVIVVRVSLADGVGGWVWQRAGDMGVCVEARWAFAMQGMAVRLPPHPPPPRRNTVIPPALLPLPLLFWSAPPADVRMPVSV
jgi:hypothetical protein